MAQLTFTQQSDGRYKATATVNNDFAIRIERHKSGQLSIGRTYVEGAEPTFFYGNAMAGLTFEKSYHDVVFPLYLTVISETLPKADGCYIQEAE
jgi:hypothetical protein